MKIFILFVGAVSAARAGFLYDYGTAHGGPGYQGSVAIGNYGDHGAYHNHYDHAQHGGQGNDYSSVEDVVNAVNEGGYEGHGGYYGRDDSQYSSGHYNGGNVQILKAINEGGIEEHAAAHGDYSGYGAQGELKIVKVVNRVGGYGDAAGWY